MKVCNRVTKKESITAASLQTLKDITKLNEVTEATAEVIEELSVLPEELTGAFEMAMQPFKVGEGFLAGKKMVAAVKMIPTRNSKMEVAGDLWKIAKSLQKIPATVEVLFKYVINSDPSSWTGAFDKPIRTISAMTTCVAAYQFIRKIKLIANFQNNTLVKDSARGKTRLLEIKRALLYAKVALPALLDVKIVEPDDALELRIDAIMQHIQSRKAKERTQGMKDGKALIDGLQAKIDFQKPSDFVDITCKLVSTATNIMTFATEAAALPLAFIEATSAAIQLANFFYVRRFAPQI